MKKFTSIAAALCLATAFCGMCTGCANGIKEQVNDGGDAAVSVAADTQHKLILCPGYEKGYGSAANTIASGATKLTADQEKTYFVSNAYFSEVTTGAALPTPTTGRTDVKFNGWRRAEDGVLVTYSAAPSLTEDMYLYAEWVSKTSVDPGPGPGPDPGPTPTIADGVYDGTTKLGGLSRNSGQTAKEEYWLGGSKLSLSVGKTVSLYMNGEKISAYIERNSSGINLGQEDQEYSEFTVTLAGDFEIYLHKNANDWSVQFVVTVPVEETTVNIPSTAACANITFGNGSVKVYIKEGSNYATSLSAYNIYMWKGSTKYFGEWSGKPMSGTLTTTQNIDANVGFIIIKGSSQTRDLSGFEAGGTYLITFATGDNGKVERIKVAS